MFSLSGYLLYVLYVSTTITIYLWVDFSPISQKRKPMPHKKGEPFYFRVGGRIKLQVWQEANKTAPTFSPFSRTQYTPKLPTSSVAPSIKYILFAIFERVSRSSTLDKVLKLSLIFSRWPWPSIAPWSWLASLVFGLTMATGTSWSDAPKTRNGRDCKMGNHWKICAANQSSASTQATRSTGWSSSPASAWAAWLG